jgi:RNA polymerase sigma factor (sigma-70 family)
VSGPVPSSVELRGFLSSGRVDAALELLHSRYRGDVRRFVRSRRPSEPADDICQEVWLAAHRALPDFRFDATPLVWLFSIASRKLVDAYRRNHRRQDDVLFDSRELLLSQCAPGLKPPTSAPTRLERKRRISAVEKILESWDMADRELLELRFVADLKPAEIVEILGLDVAPNTVSQRLVRLIQRLRREMEQDASPPSRIPRRNDSSR